MKADIILAGGSQAVRAAIEATKTIPIVVAHFEDPVREGFVDSLARPGGNVTGLSRMSGDLEGKRLELLKETVPRLRRVGVFFNPSNPTNVLVLKEVEKAAQGLGLQLQPLAADDSGDLQARLDSMSRERTEAIVIITDRLIANHRKRIVEFAVKNRLPIMLPTSTTIDEALMSYAPSNADLFRRAATYVDKILKGAKAADLPIEQPTKFELVINLKTAKQIGLTIPPNVLARADRVVK
jgi:putative tryptophan/tyrosine transport system substrate-binding protein